MSKKRKCPRSQKVSKEVKQCWRKEQWMNDYTCGWIFWEECETRDNIIIVIVSNIFWRSPLHCKKVVCCDVRCERRGLWKTSVTCTAICSQIDRGIPFSVYPSSAPHPGRYSVCVCVFACVCVNVCAIAQITIVIKKCALLTELCFINRRQRANCSICSQLFYIFMEYTG